MNLFTLVQPYPVVSFVGMCKNAGKTTALLRVLKGYRGTGVSLALTSIGRDGEARDVATDTPKPTIAVEAGTLFATTTHLLAASDVTKEIVDATPFGTPLGNVVLVRAKSAGHVALCGPSLKEQQADVAQRFFRLGATRILIDGAISRRSIATPDVCDALVLSTGASLCPDLETVVAETAAAASLLTLPRCACFAALPSKRYAVLHDAVFETDDGAEALTLLQSGASALCMRGAVTDARVQPLLRLQKMRRVLCVEDGSKVFLSREMVQKLSLCGFVLESFTTMRLLAVTVDPISAYGAHFDALLLQNAMQQAVDVPVLDVMRE